MKKIFLFIYVAIISTNVSCQNKVSSPMLDFIYQNKNRASLYLVKNDTIIARLNENKLMPLASTVKIMVAIEFAKQAANNIFSPQAYVSLKELEKYYLPNTDGNAHPSWISFERGLNHIKDDSVKLIDVARGMILFSSNANTEYIMDLVGFDNVKNNIQLLGLKQHTAIYPLVASLFMYQNPKGKKEESILKGIRELNEEQYCRFIFDMHKALKYDEVLKSKFRPQDLSLNMQKLWSDRLPASTTKEYVRVMSILNDRKFFDAKTYTILSTVLEALMENPANKNILQHAGMKGGSTIWVLTKALYATLKDGTKIELAYFFNDLTREENARLQPEMNGFELEVLTKPEFREKITEALR